MTAHIRANVLLVLLTVALCCVLYPLALWVVGQTIFPTAADGSLVKDEEGKVRGSRLIAQKFTAAKYFQPRPSAPDYNASASGGSNLGANNPKLRGRVAQALGLIARYKKDGPRRGAAVGPDVETWFQKQTTEKNRDLIAEWADANPTLATVWAGGDFKDAIVAWTKDHPEVEATWKNDNKSGTAGPTADDLAPYFFKAYSKKNDRKWPKGVEIEKAGKKEKALEAVAAGDDIRSVFFDTWLNEHKDTIDPLKDLEQVPADLVMASGSGLDPHITLRGARYQLDSVIEARVSNVKRSEAEVRATIEELLERHAFRPLGGLAGEPLVNVLEVNLALDAALSANR